MSKADDFIKDMETKVKLPIEELARSDNVMDTEDLEVILKIMNDSISVAMVLSMGPTMALMSAFVAGMAWARYKVEAESPINDMLDGVKGL